MTLLSNVNRGGRQRSLPLLMTASVSTRGMRGACFTDEEREAMYAGVLTYYIQHLMNKETQQTIVFAENSGYDLQRLRRLIPAFDEERIEFLSFPPQDFDITRGKGYNEMLMINGAVMRSRLINEADAFFKVTGRYPVYNIAHFLRQAERALWERGLDMYCDIKDHKLYDRLHLGWNGHSFECRLFGVKKQWYLDNMTELYKECNDYGGRFLEDVLFDFVKKQSQGVSLRFKREPHLGGLEGSEIAGAFIFTKRQDGPKGKLKRFVGNCIRIFTPWFKF